MTLAIARTVFSNNTNTNNTNTTTNNNNVESWEMAHQGRVLAGQAGGPELGSPSPGAVRMTVTQVLEEHRQE